MLPARNLVQEWMQRAGRPYPDYQTESTEDHPPKWRAFTEVDGLFFESLRADHVKSRDAINDCALSVYNYLTNKKLIPDVSSVIAFPPLSSSSSAQSPIILPAITQSAPTQSFSVKMANPRPLLNSYTIRYHIWVDLDNSRHIWDKIVRISAGQSIIVTLRGFCGPRMEPNAIPQLGNGITTITSTTTHMPDSADYELFADILLYIHTSLMTFTADDMFIIVSGDSSLETACYILQKKYPTINIRYAAKTSDLI